MDFLLLLISGPFYIGYKVSMAISSKRYHQIVGDRVERQKFLRAQRQAEGLSEIKDEDNLSLLRLMIHKPENSEKPIIVVVPNDKAMPGVKKMESGLGEPKIEFKKLELSPGAIMPVNDEDDMADESGMAINKIENLVHELASANNASQKEFDLEMILEHSCQTAAFGSMAKFDEIYVNSEIKISIEQASTQPSPGTQSSSQITTFIMIDTGSEDGNNGDIPFVNFLIMNIRENGGQVVLPYIGPTHLTGSREYVMVTLIQTKGNVNVEETKAKYSNRKQFPYRNFVHDNGLKASIGVRFSIVA
ncbi:hypothetical protein ACOME3_005136 [Neoechinorhynchus agilis]